MSDTIVGLKNGQWSKEQGPFPPVMLPIKLKNVKGRFLKVEVFLQANKDKQSPIIKAITAKGKQLIVN